LKNKVNLPSKSNKQKNLEKNKFVVAILKVTDGKIAGAGAGSESGYVPKCHGSATLTGTVRGKCYQSIWEETKSNWTGLIMQSPT
jgi:hypothetical protein